MALLDEKTRATLKSRALELFTAAVLLAACALAFWKLPLVDPRSGVDIWGNVAAIPSILLAGVLCGIVAWVIYNTVFRQLRNADEQALIEAAKGGSWQAVAVLVLDWLRWLVPWYVLFNATIGG